MQISSIQDSIKLFNENVSRISDLHARSLNNTDDAATARNTQLLEDLVSETSALSTTLKRRIKALERQGGSAREAQIKKQQVRVALRSFSGWHHFLTLWLSHCNQKDRVGQVEIRRGHSKFPTSRAAVQAEIQTEDGTPVQDWCVAT
jgi:t-SNARE complex subunit (syntaxin)